MNGIFLIFFLVLYFYCDNAQNSAKITVKATEESKMKNKLRSPRNLIFDENFEKAELENWTDDGNNEAHSHEFQLYVDSNENYYTKDGILHIRPTFFNQRVASECMKINGRLREGEFHPIRSARISTKESFSFKYGIVEVRAKIPTGDWLFPAIWLMPRDSVFGSWPVSGEIDIMEARGNSHLQDVQGNFVGVQQISSCLHWGPNSTTDEYQLTHYIKNNDTSGFNTAFHIYKLVWSREGLSFYVDDEEYGSVGLPDGGFGQLAHLSNDENPWINDTKSAPFDKEFYIILNLAVGGSSFFSDSYTNKGGKPWVNKSPTAASDFWDGRDQWLPTWNLPSEDSHFLVDYVRVWKL